MRFEPLKGRTINSDRGESMKKDIMVEGVIAEEISSRLRIMPWVLLSLDNKCD